MQLYFGKSSRHIGRNVGYLIFILSIPLAAIILYKSGISDYNKCLESRHEMIQLVDFYRALNGLGELKEDTLLSEAAQNKAEDMAAYNYVGHYTQDGKNDAYFARELGIQYEKFGSNLARTNLSNPAQDALELFKDSPIHDATMRSPIFSEIGVGAAEGNGQCYYAHFFARE